MDLNLDLLAIIATVVVAIIVGWYQRRKGLDAVVGDQLKLLLKYKDDEIASLRAEIETMKILLQTLQQKASDNDKTDS